MKSLLTKLLKYFGIGLITNVDVINYQFRRNKKMIEKFAKKYKLPLMG